MCWKKHNVVNVKTHIVVDSETNTTVPQRLPLVTWLGRVSCTFLSKAYSHLRPSVKHTLDSGPGLGR